MLCKPMCQAQASEPNSAFLCLLTVLLCKPMLPFDNSSSENCTLTGLLIFVLHSNGPLLQFVDLVLKRKYGQKRKLSYLKMMILDQ